MNIDLDDFKIKFINDIAIVKVDILAATQNDAKPLWEELERKLIFHRNKVIIDLSFCNSVDSTFIGMIIKILRRVNEKYGQMLLVFPNRNVVEVFSLSGIDKIIPCYNTLQEALDHFGSKTGIHKLRLEGIYSTR